MIFLKKHTNWNADLYAFNLVNVKNVVIEKFANNVMVMHCKKVSIKYLEGVEQIALNLTCETNASCGQDCGSECLKIYDKIVSPIVRKVSNYAHQNYMVLQQRIFTPQYATAAITVYAASYDAWLSNQYKFLKIFEMHNISSDDIIIRHPRIHNMNCYCPLKLVMSAYDARFPIYVYSFLMIILFIISVKYFVNYVRNRRKANHIAPQQQ